MRPTGAYWEDEKSAVWLGDCLGIMRDWPDEIVDLVMTSPPYFVEKEYETGWTWQEYSELLAGFYRETYRLLQPGRYCVVNFGDIHNGRGRMYAADVPSVYAAGVAHWEWGRAAGFDLQATRIWRKQFARVAIGYVANTRPRNAFDFEHVWTWRKPGRDGEEWCSDRRLSQRGVIGDGWSSPARIDRHCAAFPVELPSWAIQVYSRDKGEVVLDPFGGSLTTLLAAHRTDRRGWAIELEPKYVEVGLERLQTELSQLTLPEEP